MQKSHTQPSIFVMASSKPHSPTPHPPGHLHIHKLRFDPYNAQVKTWLQHYISKPIHKPAPRHSQPHSSTHLVQALSNRVHDAYHQKAFAATQSTDNWVISLTGLGGNLSRKKLCSPKAARIILFCFSLG